MQTFFLKIDFRCPNASGGRHCGIMLYELCLQLANRCRALQHLKPADSVYVDQPGHRCTLWQGSSDPLDMLYVRAPRNVCRLYSGSSTRFSAWAWSLCRDRGLRRHVDQQYQHFSTMQFFIEATAFSSYGNRRQFVRVKAIYQLERIMVKHQRTASREGWVKWQYFSSLFTYLLLGYPSSISIIRQLMRSRCPQFSGLPFDGHWQKMVTGVDSYLLVPILCLSWQSLMNNGKITDKIFSFARNWWAGFQAAWAMCRPCGNGQYHFAGMSGEALLDAGGLGFPAWDGSYDQEWIPGYVVLPAVTAASSVIRLYFPPSIPLIIYGACSVSVAKESCLWAALLLAALYMICPDGSWFLSLPRWNTGFGVCPF